MKKDDVSNVDDEDFLRDFLLHCLRKNSRSRIIDISRISGVSVAEVFDQYHQLRSDIVIKNCSLINYSETPFKYHYFIIVDFKHYISSITELSPSENMLVDFLHMNPNVNNLSLTENGLMLDVLFTSRMDYELFISKIREFDIIGISEHAIIDDVCLEKFYS